MLKSSFCLFLIILNNSLNSVLRLTSSEYYFITAVCMNYLNFTDKRGGVKQSLGAELKKYCISFPGKSSLHTALCILAPLVLDTVLAGTFSSRNWPLYRIVQMIWPQYMFSQAWNKYSSLLSCVTCSKIWIYVSIFKWLELI